MGHNGKLIFVHAENYTTFEGQRLIYACMVQYIDYGSIVASPEGGGSGGQGVLETSHVCFLNPLVITQLS